MKMYTGKWEQGSVSFAPYLALLSKYLKYTQKISRSARNDGEVEPYER